MKKKSDGKKKYNFLYSVGSGFMYSSVSAVLGTDHFVEDRAGDIPESAHFLPAYFKSEILCGTGGDRGFQHVPLLRKQFFDFYGSDGYSGFTGSASLLRNREIPLQGEETDVIVLSGDTDAAGICIADADVHHV